MNRDRVSARRSGIGTGFRGPGPGPSTTSRAPAAALLRLQRGAGNAAVGRIVQRAIHGDAVLARDARKAGKPGKSLGLSMSEQSWDRPTLAGHAADAYDAGDYGHAVALYERLYELAPDRSVAMKVAQCYDHLRDQPQAKHWHNLAHGVDDTVPAVADQQF